MSGWGCEGGGGGGRYEEDMALPLAGLAKAERAGAVKQQFF